MIHVPYGKLRFWMVLYHMCLTKGKKKIEFYGSGYLCAMIKSWIVYIGKGDDMRCY